jgi:hypothetical protein
VFSKHDQEIGKAEHIGYNIFLKITSPGSKNNTQSCMLKDLKLKNIFKNGSKWASFNQANPDTIQQYLWYQKRMAL